MKNMKRNLISLAAFAAFAITASTGAHAQDAYIGVGLPGLVSIGYAAPINANWGWRAQYAGGLNSSLDGNRDGVIVAGSLKSETLGAFADWFPFEGSGFRIVGGISANDIKANMTATGSGTTTINGTTVNMAGQYYNVNVTFPTVTPYIGIGYGHQKAEKGLGFYADLGVLIGTFNVDTSTSLVASGQVTQADLDAQSQKLRDGMGKIGVLPSVSIGAVYRF